MSVNYTLKPENTKVILHNPNSGDIKHREYICYEIPGRIRRKYCLIISSEEGFRNRIMSIISQRSIGTSAPEDNPAVDVLLHGKRALVFLGKTLSEVAKSATPIALQMLLGAEKILQKKVNALQSTEKKIPKNMKSTPVMIFNGVLHSQNPQIPFGGLRVYQDFLEKGRK